MAIELHNISKTYRSRRTGKKTVLHNINAVFERGHSYGILGINGAGKSTLLRIISGAERPTFGEVRKDVSISWRLGFASSFNSSLTGMENLRFVCRIYDADIEEVSEFVQDFAEIGGAIHEPVRNYSSGMRARLAFGLSMAIRFQVYIIDESISVGDFTFQEKCKAEFERRREEADILLTSHMPAMIKQYCDRGGVVHGGRLEMFDDVEEAVSYYEQITQ
ncbi:ABC transporter ATP-binding protein [Parasphingopyxis marina]|uniref:ABC transporter ATP-binding protein n=1 Tax=Parasphingopyxis marina TaxID=2761622 RepID=A0A842I0D2_9SPHN|nr:ABC transporter ATP-binding protein [Parasphingopyxis marina]MBC2778297.1 ABC transporter ATP-binding protein [Parasphingopyxis marina]